MNTFQPASSPYADLYVWKSVVSIDPGTGLTPSANAKAADQLQFLGDSFFCLMAFLGSTNYDNYAASYPIGGAAQITSARIPNNFSVKITQNNDQTLMSAPMTQACICGSGYLPGHQVPYPMLWPPMTSINLEYLMISPFTLFSNNSGTELDLQINFGLYGYNVPTDNLEPFLASWPAMQLIAAQNQAFWVRNFTSMTIPGLTA